VSRMGWGRCVFCKKRQLFRVHLLTTRRGVRCRECGGPLELSQTKQEQMAEVRATQQQRKLMQAKKVTLRKPDYAQAEFVYYVYEANAVAEPRLCATYPDATAAAEAVAVLVADNIDEGVTYFIREEPVVR